MNFGQLLLDSCCGTLTPGFPPGKFNSIACPFLLEWSFPDVVFPLVPPCAGLLQPRPLRYALFLRLWTSGRNMVVTASASGKPVLETSWAWTLD